MYLFITVFMHVSQAEWGFFFFNQSTSVKIVYIYAYMFVLQIAVIAFKKKRDWHIRDGGLNDKKKKKGNKPAGCNYTLSSHFITCHIGHFVDVQLAM